MRLPAPEDRYPSSDDYQRLVPLRIPGGWQVAINKLRAGMDVDLATVGGSSQFYAINPGTRFCIDVEFLPEFDPAGRFHLTVLYEPWPRTERGRRWTHTPFMLTAHAQQVHHAEVEDYRALLETLEHWIARCTVWTKEAG